MNMNISNLLITGASGFIGSFLSCKLEYNKLTLFLRERSEDSMHKEILADDISEFSNKIDDIEYFDSVIHLAVSAHNKICCIDEYYRVNFSEAINFAEKVAVQGCKRFIYLSTCNIYGMNATEKWFTEDFKSPNLDDFTKIRLNFEMALLDIGNKFNMQVFILRCPLIYSVNAPANFNKLFNFSNHSILPFGSCNSKRSFLSINNLLSAIQSVLNYNGNASGVYNLTDNYDISIKEMSSIIAKYHKKNPYQIYIPHTIIKTVEFIMNSHRISNVFLYPFRVCCNKFMDEFNWHPIESPMEYFSSFNK